VSSLVVTPAETAVAVAVSDEAIVVDEARGALHLLNPMGALVWRCFDGISSLGDICADLAEAFAMPLATVEAEVGLLTRRLLDEAVAVAPGYVRPLRSEEIAHELECGHDHALDGDPYELAPNP
jgi:hypothetical protein